MVKRTLVAGPCFQGNETSIHITVGDVTLECSIDAERQARCIAPFFRPLGSVNVSLTHNSTVYESFVVVIDTNDNKIGNHFQTLETPRNPDTPFTIKWDPNAVGGIGDTIEFKGYQVESNLNETGEPQTEVYIPLNYGKLPNSGCATLPPLHTNFSKSRNFVRQIYLAAYRNRTEKIPVTRILIRTTAAVCNIYCNAWYEKQPDQAKMN